MDAEIVNADDIGMVQSGYSTGFRQKTVSFLAVGRGIQQAFQGNNPLEAYVPSLENLAITTSTKPVIDLVTVWAPSKCTCWGLVGLARVRVFRFIRHMIDGVVRAHWQSPIE
jgi:hypothetical protein